METAIAMRGITKTYRLENVHIPVLKGVNLDIGRGEFVAIMGVSGSGKSTLMNIMGCLDRPTSGQYVLEGYDLTTLSDNELAYIRNQIIGFVFQQFNLLPRLTALENVMLPMIYAGISKQQRREYAFERLAQVGLAQYANQRPNQLSGGQQQRVAIARALINQPVLILADEPTGSLDSRTSQEVMDLLIQLNQQGITIVVVTHESEIASKTQRTLHIQDGLLRQFSAA